MIRRPNGKIVKGPGMAKDPIKTLRSEMKELRAIMESAEKEELPYMMQPGEERSNAVQRILRIAADRRPFMADLAKAGLELASYNDRVAVALLRPIVEEDYRKLITKAKKDAREQHEG